MRYALIALLLLALPLNAAEYLKQSTAVTVKVGPFVDATDGVTAETSLTLSQADFRLSKNGGNMAQKNETSSATHDEIGVYDVSLDTTDTGTLGRLRIDVQESGALPVWAEFVVVPANTYDSLIGATDTLQSDVTQWSGTNVASPATAGYPAVTIKDGTGTGEIDTASGLVKVDGANSTGLINSAGITTAVEAADVTLAADQSAVTDWGGIDVSGSSVLSTPLYRTNQTGGRVWFVDDSAAGAGTGYNPTDAFTAISSAISAATTGDTIVILAGTYSGNVNLNKGGITVTGVGSTTILTHNSGNTFDVNADNCVIQDMQIASTDATNGVGIDLDSTKNVTLKRLNVVGTLDGVQSIVATQPTFIGCGFTGTYDGGNAGGVVRGYWEDCTFTTDGTYAGATSHRGYNVASASGTFNRCTFVSSRTAAGSIPLSAVECGNSSKAVTFLDCYFDTTASHASNTSVVNGISYDRGDTSTPMNVIVRGGRVRLSNAGSGASRSIDATNSANDRCRLINVALDSTLIAENTAGTNVLYVDYEAQLALKPTTAGRKLDVSSGGEAGIDWANIGSPTSSVNLSNTTAGLIDGAITAPKIATDAITNAKIASGAIVAGAEATGFSTHSAADVWSAGTRTITGGSGVTLAADQSGVTDLGGLDVSGGTVAASGNWSTFNPATDSVPGSPTSGTYAEAIKAAKTNTDPLATMISANKYTSTALENAPSAGAAAIPVNQVAVPASRTWKLQDTSSGLVGESSRRMIVGEVKIFAVDFAADLPTNGRLTDFDSITIESGTSGGVTFDTDGDDTFGVDKNLAKLEITAVTAGTYVLEATVSYDSSDGGGTAKARVTLVVAE